MKSIYSGSALLAGLLLSFNTHAQFDLGKSLGGLVKQAGAPKEDPKKTAAKTAAPAAASSAAASTPAAAEPAKTGEFDVGSKVEAQHFGRFRPAVITSVRVIPTSKQKRFKVRWDDDGGEYEVGENQMRAPAFVNFTGTDFKVGQYVHAWYSNNWLESKILEVKDGQIKIQHGGYGEKWFAFDDRTIRNKVREESEAKGKQRDDEFVKEVAGQYFGYAKAVMWATGDERFAKETPWAFQSMIGQKPPEMIKNLPAMAKGLDEMAKLMREKYADFNGIDVANHPQMKAWSEKNKEIKYSAEFYRQTMAKSKEGLPLFIKKMVQPSLDEKLKNLKELSQVREHAAGGKGIAFAEGKADLATPGDGSFEPGTKDVIQGDGSQFNAALKNFLQPLYAAAGLSENEAAPVLEEVNKLMQEARAEFKKNLPVMTASFKYKDPALEQFFRSYITKKVPGATVIKVGTTDADWKVWKNSIGIPESRTKWGGVHFKDPVTGLCAYSSIQAGQNYGGGKFSTETYFSGLGGAYFTYSLGKCG